MRLALGSLLLLYFPLSKISISFSISSTMDVNVATAMRRMLKHKIHRVWIMNDESMPLGAVTVSDILTLFWSENLRVEA